MERKPCQLLDLLGFAVQKGALLSCTYTQQGTGIAGK